MRRIFGSCFATLMLLGGCTGRQPGDLFAPEAGTIVVDAFLVVGRPFPIVLLSETLAADVPYSWDDAALRGADVRVSGGGIDLEYHESGVRSGTYVPSAVDAPLVQPGVVYSLAVTTTDGRRVQASTSTPESFGVGDWLLLDAAGSTIERRLSTFAEYGDSLFARPENQLVYSEGLLEGRFDPSGLVGIQVGLFSRTPDSPRVIDPEFFDPQDLEDLPRVNSSPPLEARDGKIRLPWFAIFYEGKYVFKVWTMDRNWFDLARTDPVLSGGGFGFGGQAGDDFERPIFHVEGGIGLFGSGAVDSVGVVVHPRP